MRALASCLLVLLACGCISTSQFVTGRTLRPGTANMSLGVQNGIWIGSDGNSIPSSLAEANPRIAMNVGLPGRLELCAAVMPSSGLEGGLRWQLNPRSFTLLDAAMGGRVGTHFAGGYWRGDLTVSHRFKGLEPYVYIARYGRRGGSPFEDDNWFSEKLDDFSDAARNTRTLGGGVVVPITDWIRLVPEYRHDWMTIEGGWGLEGDFDAGMLGLSLVLGPWKQ